MSITKVSPALIQVANNVTSTTIGNTTSIPSLTFDASGVIIAASNTTVTVSNTNITGTITNSQLGTGAVSNTKIASGAVEQYFADTGYNTQFRNRIINGDMRIDQRNAGASVTPNNSYTLDRFFSLNSQTSKFTVQQSTTAPSGFTNSVVITSSSAYSVVSGDYFTFSQRIEGFNTADLAWGTADAKTVTLSFWVRSSLTGTFGGSLRNSAGNRSYPFTYSISSANTWEQKSVTITGDTTGTWLTTNEIGIEVDFSLGAGSTFSGTAGAWAGANYVSATGATSVVGTNGATFYLTGVQLEVGSVATPFEHRPFGTEFMLCQRYYEVKSGAFAGYSNGSGMQMRYPVSFSTTKRASPTNTYTTSSSSPSGGTFAFEGTGANDVGGTVVRYTTNTSGNQYGDYIFNSSAEL